MRKSLNTAHILGRQCCAVHVRRFGHMHDILSSDVEGTILDQTLIRTSTACAGLDGSFQNPCLKV